MIRLKGVINKLLKSTLLFVFLIFAHQINAQDAKSDSIKNLRRTTAAGGWFSGGVNTSFISIGQNGAGILQSATDGNILYGSSFGMLGPVNIEKPNTGPLLSVGSSGREIYPASFPITTAQKFAQVNTLDAEGDNMQITITSKNKLVNFEELSNLFTPGSDLSEGYSKRDITYKYVQDSFPGIYDDVIVVKAVDERGEETQIEQSVVQQLVDVPHEIAAMSVEKADDNTQRLSFSMVDPIFNLGYRTGVDIFAWNPSTLTLREYRFVKDFTNAELRAAGSTNLAGTLDIKSSDYPELFVQGNLIVVKLDAESLVPVFGDSQYFSRTSQSFFYEVLENGGTRPGAAAASAFDFDDQDVKGRTTNAVVASDGSFFTTSDPSSTFESDPIEIRLSAIDFGNFDLKKAQLSITDPAKNGSLSTPVLVTNSKNLSEWVVTYTPSGETGYLDSLQFSVFNPDRNFTASSYTKIEVINENDPPTIVDIEDKVINEDQALTFALEFADVDNEVIATAIAANANDFTVQIVGNQLTVTPKANFSGTTSIQINVTETSGSNPLTTTENFALTVNAVNDSPVIAAIGNQTVVEDNVFTYRLQTTDIDAAIPLFAYSITPSVSGVANVSVQGNNLTITPTANYTGNVDFTVIADDGRATATSKSAPQTFTLAVSPVNDAPVSTATIPTQNIVDGLPAYTIDLGIYFNDVETADSDLTITQNSAGTLFNLAIDKDKLRVTPILGQNGSESVTFTVSDGELSVTQNVIFSVQSNNTDITATAISDVAVAEDFGNFTIPLNSVFTDAGDPNAVFTYTIGGLSNINGSVNGNNLVLTSSANFSGAESVFLVASANGKTSFTRFNVNVSPVNDAPTLGVASAQSIQEDGQLSGLFISFTDIDTDVANLTFTATSSNESLLKSDNLTIVKGSGGIILSASPEANATGSATISVVVNDGEFSATRQFGLNVLSVNDNPTVASTLVAGATEDVAYSQAIAGLFSDIDGDNLSYTIEANPTWLSISNGSLVGTPINSNVGNATFFITANDGSGGTVRQAYTITVTNTNDAPIVAVQTPDILAAEDVILNTTISSQAFSDPDNDNLVLSAAYEGATWLTFDPATRRFSGTPLATDIGTVNIVLTAQDPSGATVTDSIVLTVVNTNDVPSDLTLATAVINENINIGTVLGALATTDEDSGDSFTYSLVSGAGATNNGSFVITNGSLVTSGAIDFETQSTLSVRVQTTDAAGASFIKVFSIKVNNVNEAPTDLSSTGLTIIENTGADVEVGALSTTDPDAGDSFVYSLSTETDNANFKIIEGKLVTNGSFNFEEKSNYAVRVKTQDVAGLSYEETLTISVLDANDNPTDLGISATTVAENSPISTSVGNLTVTDEDVNDTFKYSLVAGEGDSGNAFFEITGGALLTKSILDFEMQNSYPIRLRVRDSGGSFFDKNLTITVSNVAEPAIAAIAGVSFDATPLDEPVTSTFIIENTGDTEINVTSIEVPPAYSVDQSSFVVAVGTSVTVTVTFRPTAAESYNGEIIIQSNLGETRVDVVGEGTIITAIDDNVLESDEIGLYPNPAKNFITIDLSLIPQIRPNLVIMDIKGNEVWSKTKLNERKVRVDVSSYPAGTYLIRISSDKGSVVKKLLIIK